MDNPFRGTNLRVLTKSELRNTDDDSTAQPQSLSKCEPENSESDSRNDEEQRYLAAVGGLLVKARVACGQPPLDPDIEFIPACATWAEILFGVVPYARLTDAYMHALRTRKSTFPLNVSELCEAWRQIQESERYAPKPNKSEGCPVCKGTGMEYFPAQRASRPCGCRKAGVR